MTVTAARERIVATSGGVIRLFHGDFREISLEAESYDVILAAAVLHHLRDDQDWESAFRKIYTLLRPGGSFWVTDLVSHEIDAVNEMMWRRYADYLIHLGGQDVSARS